MIAQLVGKVVRKDPDRLVVDVGGVGYLVHCTEATSARMPVGTDATLRVHTSVREDAIELFGFASELEERLFHELNRVPGIGPRMALNILAGGAPEEIAGAIVRGDMARLKKLPGVGKKTAERLVVDLRERLAPYAGAAPVADLPKGAPSAAGPMDELVQALAALGYKSAEAERLAATARERAPGGTLEELVKEALRAR